jgi:hypothetical protein
MEQREFVTADLYLSSAICILLNTQPSFRVENGRTLFIFPISDGLYKAMNAYNNGTPINAYELTQMIKRLRAEMLTRRNMRGTEMKIMENSIGSA